MKFVLIALFVFVPAAFASAEKSIPLSLPEAPAEVAPEKKKRSIFSNSANVVSSECDIGNHPDKKGTETFNQSCSINPQPTSR